MRIGLSLALFVLVFSSLASAQVDPDTALKASIDRFSMDAGTLFVRDSVSGLPGPNEPINFDMDPFISKGFGKNGEFVSYYNFDVQSTTPAPIYVLFREGETMPVEGQLNIVDVIPGDSSYNDFWRINKVTVPSDYVANTIVSYEQIIDGGYAIEQTSMLVNCPIVPEGSSAMLRYNMNEDTSLTRGWYDSTVVFYFNFSEAPITVDMNGMVPLSPIYVTFNINPGGPGGGPPSGFKTDSTGRTHNVPATLPEDETYSPLWSVNIYDNADFDMVHDLASAQMANILVFGAADVNCPIVSNEPATVVENRNVIPNNFVLEQNFPNPFNPTTQIEYSIPKDGFVNLTVYNTLGQQVASLVNENLKSGKYQVTFNASRFASGVYYYRLVSGSDVMVKKMMILK